LEPILLLIVNSQVLLGVIAKMAKASLPHLRKFTRPMHFYLGMIMVVLAYIQAMTGVTTFFGICQPSEYGNCFSHFGLGSAFLWLAGIGLGQSQGVFILPTSLDNVISFVILISGFINATATHRWGTSWSHKDYQHSSSGFLWVIGGLLCLLMNFKFKSSPNPFPALLFFIQGFQMILHVQHSQYAILMHTLFGWGLVFASICKWISIYTKNDEILILSYSIWVLVGVLFMASNSDAMTKMSTGDIDVNSYATMLSAAGIIIILYIFLLVFTLRESKDSSKAYDRIESNSTIENEPDSLDESLLSTLDKV
jgi:Protein of unknown function (Ytp1)